MWLTLKYTPQPAFTFQYPAERRPTSPRFSRRAAAPGRTGHGGPDCIVCDQCAKACPTTSSPWGGTASQDRRSKSSTILTLICPRCSFCGAVRRGVSDQTDQGAHHERGLRARELQPRNTGSCAWTRCTTAWRSSNTHADFQPRRFLSLFESLASGLSPLASVVQFLNAVPVLEQPRS